MLSRVSIAIVNFWRWWLRELKGIFSPPRRLGAGRHNHRLVLSLDDGNVRILDERTHNVAQLNRTHSTGKSGSTLDDAVGELAAISQLQPTTPVGLRFGSRDCFVRQVEMPEAAHDDIGKMLDLEMERTTPFKRDDVLAVHYIDTEADSEIGKIDVLQVVIKRETVEKAVIAMSRAGIEPAFADCWNRDASAPHPVDFLLKAQADTSDHNNGIGLVPALVAMSLALAVAAGATAFLRHKNALDEIELANEKAKTQAHVVRQVLDKSQTASARISSIQHLAQTRVSVARILEELTAVMPDSTWLNDLRIEDGNIEISGYARSAAALIPLIEKSKLFSGASLTAPVMLDARHDKERFSIRVRVSGVTSEPERHGRANPVNGK